MTDNEKIKKAIYTAMEYGGFDGRHHKQWALDQVVRILAGEKYDQVVEIYKAGEDGPDTYGWDEGVAP